LKFLLILNFRFSKSFQLFFSLLKQKPRVYPPKKLCSRPIMINVFPSRFVRFFPFFRMNSTSKSTNICSVVAYFDQIAMKTSLNCLSWRRCELRISVASSLSDFRMPFFRPTIAFFVRDYDFELDSKKRYFFSVFQVMLVLCHCKRFEVFVGT